MQLIFQKNINYLKRKHCCCNNDQNLLVRNKTNQAPEEHPWSKEEKPVFLLLCPEVRLSALSDWDGDDAVFLSRSER